MLAGGPLSQNKLQMLKTLAFPIKNARIAQATPLELLSERFNYLRYVLSVLSVLSVPFAPVQCAHNLASIHLNSTPSVSPKGMYRTDAAWLPDYVLQVRNLRCNKKLRHTFLPFILLIQLNCIMWNIAIQILNFCNLIVIYLLQAILELKICYHCLRAMV